MPLHIQSDDLSQCLQPGEFFEVSVVRYTEFDIPDPAGGIIHCNNFPGSPVDHHAEGTIFPFKFGNHPFGAVHSGNRQICLQGHPLEIVDLRQIDLVGDLQFNGLEVASHSVHPDDFSGYLVDGNPQVSVSFRQVGDQCFRLRLSLHIQSDDLCQRLQTVKFFQIFGIDTELYGSDLGDPSIHRQDFTRRPVNLHAEAAVFTGQITDNPGGFILSLNGKFPQHREILQPVEQPPVHVSADAETDVLKIAGNCIQPDNSSAGFIHRNSQIAVLL